MNFKLPLRLGVVLALASLGGAAAASAGCTSSTGDGGSGGASSSSSSSGKSTGALPTTGASNPNSSGALPTTGATPTTSSNTADACATYCIAIQTNCTTANAQYASDAECMTACNGFPLGMAGDQTGDSLACRQYHADAAAGMPAVHCPHAGPDGGGVCVD